MIRSRAALETGMRCEDCGERARVDCWTRPMREHGRLRKSWKVELHLRQMMSVQIGVRWCRVSADLSSMVMDLPLMMKKNA